MAASGKLQAISVPVTHTYIIQAAMVCLCTEQSSILKREVAYLFFSHVFPGGEIGKLQQHLHLLREQYVRLQQRHAELEQRYTRELSATGNVGPDHFVSRLLALVHDLHEKPLYR